MITAAEANEILRYDPETGYLHWRIKPRSGVKAGDRAGSFQKCDGYIKIQIKHNNYLAHRIIWLMNYGEFPPEQIDHINQVPHDNRLENLRAVTNQENAKNKTLPKNNTSGACGVTWAKNCQRWKAQIRVNQELIYLGIFVDWFDAVCAKKAADAKHNFSIFHGRERE